MESIRNTNVQPWQQFMIQPQLSPLENKCFTAIGQEGQNKLITFKPTTSLLDQIIPITGRVTCSRI